MSNKILVFCTISSSDAADSFARTLVNEELVACVNIVPAITSVYRWQGAIESAEEILLIMKTRDSLFEALRNRIVELHPYEVPEVIAIPIAAGHPPYMEWIGASTKDL